MARARSDSNRDDEAPANIPQRTGPKRSTSERLRASKAFKEILENLAARKPELVAPAADLICEAVLKDERRLLKVRALLLAICRDENPHSVPPIDFAELADCQGWPSRFRKELQPLRAENLNNFLKTRRPRDATSLGQYLLGLHYLRRFRHPCFIGAIPEALLDSCEPLAAFEQAAELAANTRGDLGVWEIIQMAEEVYHFVSRGRERVTQDSFADLLHAPLFHGLQGVQSDEDLQSSVHIGEAIAIRLGISGASYVASRIQFVLVAPPRSAAVSVLYLRTLMKPFGGDTILRSHGVVLPRQTDTYFVQYHFGGAGLNITAIPNGELQDGDRPFIRGLILAVDRDNGQGALASRIALIPLRGLALSRSSSTNNLPSIANAVIGTLTRAQLRKAFSGDHLALCDQITQYLHTGEPTQLEPLADYPAREALASWKALVTYASNPEVAKLANNLGPNETALVNRNLRPLRALPT